MTIAWIIFLAVVINLFRWTRKYSTARMNVWVFTVIVGGSMLLLTNVWPVSRHEDDVSNRVIRETSTYHGQMVHSVNLDGAWHVLAVYNDFDEKTKAELESKSVVVKKWRTWRGTYWENPPSFKE